MNATLYNSSHVRNKVICKLGRFINISATFRVMYDVFYRPTRPVYHKMWYLVRGRWNFAPWRNNDRPARFFRHPRRRPPPPLVLIPCCSTANITMGRYRRMQHTFFGGIVLQLVFMQIWRRQVGAHFAPMKNAWGAIAPKLNNDPPPASHVKISRR